MTEQQDILIYKIENGYRLGIDAIGNKKVAEALRNEIIENEKIVERLKQRITNIESIPKNDEDFIFTHYKLELEDLKQILEGVV